MDELAMTRIFRYSDCMIAYFCAEYSLDPRLRTYAGGLGILAGDTVKEMGDQAIPFVGLGLFYYKGYLAREYDWYTPESADLQLLKDTKGNILLVSVPIGGRDVYARAWVYRYKTATVYLLDTMLHQNHPMDQQISYYLYDEDIRVRLAQEMMLGIGGVRLLKSIGIEPHVYHMNEGHSTFLYLETLPEVPIVFTNHTVIAEGNHMYESRLIKTMFERYFVEKGKCTYQEFLDLGACQYPDVFSMTKMAIRVARRMNGVSMIHTKKLAETYPDSRPIAITNGIHVSTWFRSHSHHEMPSIVTPRDMRKIHDENKTNLLLYLQHMTGTRWDDHSLIIGWARRIIQYKRPLAIFTDVARLQKILSSSAIPVRVLISGIPHPRDAWANDALRIILSLLAEKFRDQIVYVPNYSPDMARMITAGCDVWLNTPQVGLEACGTSGMKSALNGVLQLSTADGWMAEVDISRIGWQLDDADVGGSLYDTLEQHVIPAYATYLTHHDRFGWLHKMMDAHALIRTRFSTRRMVQEYSEHLWSISSTPEKQPTQALARDSHSATGPFARPYAYQQMS